MLLTAKLNQVSFEIRLMVHFNKILFPPKMYLLHPVMKTVLKYKFLIKIKKIAFKLQSWPLLQKKKKEKNAVLPLSLSGIIRS